MVWYGGALLASGLMALYGWRSRLDLLELADLFLPATAVGLGIGRVGCFLNGCCYGRPTTLPWGVPGAGGPHTHPTQLYETLACLALAGAATLFWYRRRSQGQVSMLVLRLCRLAHLQREPARRYRDVLLLGPLPRHHQPGAEHHHRPGRGGGGRVVVCGGAGALPSASAAPTRCHSRYAAAASPEAPAAPPPAP